MGEILETIGVGGDRASVAAFLAAIPSDLNGDAYIGEVISDHSSGALSDLGGHTATGGGSITLRAASNALDGNDAFTVTYSSAPSISNVLISSILRYDVTVRGIRWDSFNIVQTSVSDGANPVTLTLEDMVIYTHDVNGVSSPLTLSDTTPLIKFNFRNISLIDIPTSIGGSNQINFTCSTHTTAQFDSLVFIENCTLYTNLASTSSATGRFRVQTIASSQTLTIRNLAVLDETPATSSNAVKSFASGTLHLANCARNLPLSGTVTEASAITDLVAADFLSVAPAESDAFYIDQDSRLYEAGTDTGVSAGSTTDIIGNSWPTPRSIGVYSAAPVPRDPVRTLNIASDVTTHTTVEIELSEHLTGWASTVGDSWTLTCFKDDFNLYNGDKISVFKKISSLEEDGVALTEKASSAQVESNAGSWWQDIPNQILYIHFSNSETPSDHTVVINFPFYVADSDLKLTVDSDVRLFEPRIDPRALPTVSQSYNEALVGTVNISGGNFSLLNGDGLFDQLLVKYIWLNRKAVIKRGFNDDTYASYYTLATNTITEWKLDRSKVSFKVKNRFTSLKEDIPSQVFSIDDTETFAGTTYGSTYPDKLPGKPRPLAWGVFDERQAPILHMIREDKSFVSFAANYSTPSVTSVSIATAAPAYNSNVEFETVSNSVEANADGKTNRFKAVLDGTTTPYLTLDNDIWRGYYVQTTTGDSEKARINSFTYDEGEGTATFSLETGIDGEGLNRADNTDFDFKIYCPVYHFFIADHPIKSIDQAYVDKGGDEGALSWIHLDWDEPTTEGDWSRVIIPIPGYSTSTKARLAFTSKDVLGGSSAAQDTLENHADIARDILQATGILSTPFINAELDTDTFDDSKTARDYPLTIYLNEPIQAIDVFKVIRRSVLAKMLLTNEGKIQYVAWDPVNKEEDDTITVLGIEEVIGGEIVFSSAGEDLYYGFVIKYAKDGDSDDYLEERYTYELTRYLYKITKMKTFETFLRERLHAEMTAQRYTYFNREKTTKVAMKIPHNYLTDGTIADDIGRAGEYLKIVTTRGPGDESEAGGEFGQYKNTYEVLKVTNSPTGMTLAGDDIKGLTINAGVWSSDAVTSPTGYWANDDGETTDGDDTTKNTSLWA
jgi:hypothetical protein